MEYIYLEPDQSYGVMVDFLDYIHDNYKDRVSAEDHDNLAALLSTLESDPASPADWIECYTTTFGRFFTPNNRINRAPRQWIKLDDICKSILSIEKLRCVLL